MCVFFKKIEAKYKAKESLSKKLYCINNVLRQELKTFLFFPLKMQK